METSQSIHGQRFVIERNLVPSTIRVGRLRIDELLDAIRKEVNLIREEHPFLASYQLHDVTLGVRLERITVLYEFRI